MENVDQLISYLENHSFIFDELGRVVIQDPALLASLQGALGAGLSFMPMGNSNGACVNGTC